jgi:carbamoyl-phosphate synthase small subunit
MNTSKKAYLLLADGTLFTGSAFGAIGTTSGEICFNTGMTGYQEIFTDPSYYGQIVVMNTAHVGNYGVNNEDVESDSVKIAGLIGKNLTEKYSRVMSNGSLQDYLVENNIVSIHELDTRALVAHIRNSGAMNCIISSDIDDIDILKQKLAAVPSMEGLDLSEFVSTKEAFYVGNSASEIRISVLDFGVKRNILKCMTDRGAYLKVFPSKSTFEDLQTFKPTAYFISNGPGDPSSMRYAVDVVSKIIQSGLPVFGICLGHQLIALANGAKTYKMHHGHRGINHPVLNLQTMRSEISTQNHGFAVEADSVSNNDLIEITHVNLNDNTLEGIKMKSKPVFSVQYHPEATPGPHDSRYLFDDFIELIGAHKNK